MALSLVHSDSEHESNRAHVYTQPNRIHRFDPEGGINHAPLPLVSTHPSTWWKTRAAASGVPSLGVRRHDSHCLITLTLPSTKATPEPINEINHINRNAPSINMRRDLPRLVFKCSHPTSPESPRLGRRSISGRYLRSLSLSL